MVTDGQTDQWTNASCEVTYNLNMKVNIDLLIDLSLNVLNFLYPSLEVGNKSLF